ncbi:iron permease FTR1 family-domain-containing protein [Halteromyces radiatus]|uniref:iron permease FTR1 family-domain-containing protein n=1 Tax=Halteromyces radiatus TaxID=101107 RepID=UPI00221F1D78|nr:iron permease FTR1 family-domain-containing protein [Halteromyces radiatus]KAI8076852.1 iron permease FTR1 family-domain-containing protein [Halteromyces radiatus]
MASEDYFNVPIFFILFRETTEASIIVSVLLSFLKMTFDNDSLLFKRLRKHVWLGAVLGLVICLCIGAAFIAVWYTVLTNLWGDAELIWEGAFSLIATIMITAMGLAFLKAEKLQDKWKIKLAKAMEVGQKGKRQSFKHWMQKYSFFLLPFITILREGLEAVVFIGGVSLNVQAKSIPIAAITGFLAGSCVGLIIYRGGSMLQLRWFFIFSTVILYLVAAGLMSKAVGFFEQYQWNKVIGGESAEEGGKAIPYKVTTSVWHVSWGNPENYTGSTGGYQIFNSILGWNNTATIGTIVSYCLYWILISFYLVYLFFKQRHTAIAKAERGEFYEEEDADAALQHAKKFVNQDGVILGTDEVTTDGELDEKVADPEIGLEHEKQVVEPTK